MVRAPAFLRLLVNCAWLMPGVGALAQLPGDRIAAYGRVSPGERAVVLAVPSYQGAPGIVAELFVKSGDHVQPGQKLACTASRKVAQAELEIARAHLAMMNARMAALKAGPRGAEHDAQEATVESLAAELRAAKARKKPESTAGKTEAVAQEEALEWKVTASQRQLDALGEVRPADLAVALAETAEAAAAVKRAEVLLAGTEVAAPFEGQVLRILTYPGEGGAGGPLLELGAVQAMVIRAELSVADAARVKPGAHASFTSEAWAGELTGTVTRVDPRVERSPVSAPSVFANVDRQIVEATIEPAQPEKLAALAGAPVTVSIGAAPGK